MAGGRELTIYAIDVSPSMSEKRTADDPSTGATTSVTNLEYGLEVVKHQVANMLLAGLKTVHCGVVLFGTERTDNSLASSGYEYIWEYVRPGQPSAITLLHINKIEQHLTTSEKPFKGDLLSAIILCNHHMGETLAAKKWTRKIVLVTDAQTETDWSGWKDQRDKMRADNVTLEVVGLDFDDPEVGYIQPNKPEIKATNEKILHKLCRSLANASSCSTALVAVMNAQSPQPRVVGSTPAPVLLSLGYPDQETAAAEGYDPQESLFMRCELRKCTSIIRPMSAKKMSKLGISSELDRRRKDLDAMDAGAEMQQYLPADKDNEDTDGILGLLQVNRKHVYAAKKSKDPPAKAAGPDDDSDDLGMEDSSDEEPGPLEAREVDRENLAKAYKYGASLVVVDKEDEAAIRQSFSECLEIRGFVNLKNIPRHHLLNNVYYLYPIATDYGSQISFSAIVRAMNDANRAALARYVGRSVVAEPKLVILIPVVEPTIRYFLFIQVPFVDDLRQYAFPPLPTGPILGNRTVRTQYVLTDEMQDAMDELVDKMDLSAEEGSKTADGRTAPWLELENTCNPAVHHVKNCVLYRLSHPTSIHLAPVHQALAKCMAPPPHVVQRAASSLDRAKQLFDIKTVPARPKSKRKQVQQGTNGDADDKIDLDDILGDL
ncbi:ATP-dependent DNA helicase II subunit 2 [Puccinia graminis f. sp. tritici]|uniref:ATP-dependent DNA helicase II subunit 2 n=1 Tax=Puccinia graminis f. sp. tritici TaxID=56615 RepID=A0A5B0RXR4_PUCGR|nr:ATP-dependent DNA helicase II subunit 2 [Puccinia graminis f. sp. tritici]